MAELNSGVFMKRYKNRQASPGKEEAVLCSINKYSTVCLRAMQCLLSDWQLYCDGSHFSLQACRSAK